MELVLKRQQFEDSKSKEIELRISKYQYMGMYNNKKGQSLDKYEGESEEKNVRYILLLFITFAPLRKELNRPISMSVGTRSLNNLVYVPKIG